MKEEQILNYISPGLEIKMTVDKEKRGRGVFAKKKLKKGELLVVERCIIEADNTLADDN